MVGESGGLARGLRLGSRVGDSACACLGCSPRLGDLVDRALLHEGDETEAARLAPAALKHYDAVGEFPELLKVVLRMEAGGGGQRCWDANACSSGEASYLSWGQRNPLPSLLP